MNITRADFIYGMWNLWSSLAFIILSMSLVFKSAILCFMTLIFSFLMFSVWASFIYDLLIKRNKILGEKIK